MPNSVSLRQVTTPSLHLAYEEHGPANAEPVILLHGFPYDVRAYDEIAPPLAERGYRVIVPYLRGYGPTRFVSEQIMRSGQQAALWPQRVKGLMSADGYNIQDIPGACEPRAPETEHGLWYQYYFNTQRGVDGLTANRRAFCELLWRQWSPTWNQGPQCYGLSAPSFDNPDFVEVVIHSYRHRFGYVPGDPSLESIEQALQAQPPIQVPTIALCGADDGVGPATEPDPDIGLFSGPYQRSILPGVGHNLPQEAPQATLDALLELLQNA